MGLRNGDRAFPEPTLIGYTRVPRQHISVITRAGLSHRGDSEVQLSPVALAKQVGRRAAPGSGGSLQRSIQGDDLRFRFGASDADHGCRRFVRGQQFRIGRVALASIGEGDPVRQRDAEMSIYTDEIFGPVLSMIPGAHGVLLVRWLEASLFGDTHAHGAEGFHFFTRGKVVTSRWPDPPTVASTWVSRPTAESPAVATRSSRGLSYPGYMSTLGHDNRIGWKSPQGCATELQN